MGQQFFYCQSCGIRVTSEDLQGGEALRTSTRIKCRDCARKQTQRRPAPATPAR